MFKKVGAFVTAASAVVLVPIGSAMAAVPADVTTALTDAKSDATTVAGTVIAIIVAIAAFSYMRRALR